MTLAEIILKCVAKASSMRPMASKDIWIAVRKARADFDPDELPSALQFLTESCVLATCRITRGDITQDTYWPTGLRNPVLIGAPPMSNPNTLASKLLRAIVLHGPITGADLAIKSGIPAKSIDSLLESATTRDAVTSRRGFCAEKGRELKHYMTTTQAADWDAREAEAESEKRMDVVGQNGNTGEHYAAHAMSAPVSEAASADPENAKDELANLLEKRTEETAALRKRTTELESDLEKQRTLLAAKTETIVLHENTIHDLRNDVFARNLILHQISDRLGVSRIEDIPAAFDELTQALSARAIQPKPASGRMALIVYTDTDTDLQFLEPFVTEEDASKIALNQVNGGGSERCAVIRVLGEAHRPAATWKPLVAPAIATLRGEHQEAA